MPEIDDSVDLTPWLRSDPFTIAADWFYRNVLVEPISYALESYSRRWTRRWCEKILFEMK